MSKKKPTKDGKDARLEIRLDSEEKEAFQTAADIDGRSVSNWVLRVCRESARGTIKDAGLPDPFASQKGK